MSNCEENPSRVSFDPGWNDPPKFSYGTQPTIANRPRNFLNKRVAFPLSANSSPNAGVPSLNLPPVSNSHLPPGIEIKPIAVEQIEDDINIETTLKDVKDVLLSLLDTYSELGPKSHDIKRRISVMEDMWLSGKLTSQVQSQMKHLAYALRDDQPRKADEIHKALMVDHVSSVSSWMPGVKQLIHHGVARSDLLAIDDE